MGTAAHGLLASPTTVTASLLKCVSRRWECSVLAPFATVIYNGGSSQYGNPGHIDGSIVARAPTNGSNPPPAAAESRRSSQ